MDFTAALHPQTPCPLARLPGTAGAGQARRSRVRSGRSWRGLGGQVGEDTSQGW